VEVETAQKVVQALLALKRRDARQMQKRTGLGVQAVELMLGKVAYRQMLTGFQFASHQR